MADLFRLQDGRVGAEVGDLAVEGLRFSVGAEEPVAISRSAGDPIVADLSGHFLAVDEQGDGRGILLALNMNGHLVPCAWTDLSADCADDGRIGRVTLAGGPFEFAGDEPEFAAVAIADTGGIAGPIQSAEDGAIGGGCTGLEPDGEGRAAFRVDAGFLGEDAGFGLLGGLQGLGQKLGVFGGESFAQSGRRERIRLECGDLAVERGDGCIHPLEFGLLFAGRGREQRHRVGDAAIFAVFEHVVKEREHPVVVLLADRVELVVVAAGAFHRQAEQGGACGADAVGDVFDAILLVDDAAFAVDDVVTVEGRGEALVGRRLR